MIAQTGKSFRLDTDHTSYLFRVTPFGHLEHVWYGPRLTEALPYAQSKRTEASDCQEGESKSCKDSCTDTAIWDALAYKRTAAVGSAIAYDESDPLYCLDQIPLEWSGQGRGDYRELPCEILMPDGTYVQDFVYRGRQIVQGACEPVTLPGAYGDRSETLIIYLQDAVQKVFLTLYYTVFEEADVIVRRAVLRNEESLPLSIRRLLSCTVDLPDRGYRMVTFDGGWIRETHRHDTPLNAGLFVNQSMTGASSNRHNPGFLLAEQSASEDTGYVYGFNLIYSGNHYGFAEVGAQGTVRAGLGIQPRFFDWTLRTGESFETPEAVLTVSDQGLNGVSGHFHDFVNENIVRGQWKKKERPVLFNNWEATFFDFNEGRLLSLARRAKDLGAELFVLDDGWFGARDSDTAGLGDYTVNRKKLPSGLCSFGDKLKSMGLRFGLWFEPEMVNEDSELYRAHPEYALKAPGRSPVKGRHQLVLDLCNPEVQDYIVEQVSRTLDENGIDYVKWDMNRHIAENVSPYLMDQGISQGEFYHRYVLGLYQVLRRIFYPRPHILFESCSSGGNRFDLGMLCFCAQIWASDDTDPVERLAIQGGLSYLYPLSSIGAHVSMAPHQQTLRDTPLSTRFNAAAFGCLGYELDLKYLSPKEREEIRGQIAFYKKYRALFQYGCFRRVPSYEGNRVRWQCVSQDRECAVSGFFQTLARASQESDRLVVTGLMPGEMYQVDTKEQYLYIRRFGGLMKHVLPVELNPEGFLLRTANRHYTLKDCTEHYIVSGQALAAGVWLNHQFMGTGYNEQTRLLGDFGSQLYVICRQEEPCGRVDESGAGSETECVNKSGVGAETERVTESGAE